MGGAGSTDVGSVKKAKQDDVHVQMVGAPRHTTHLPGPLRDGVGKLFSRRRGDHGAAVQPSPPGSAWPNAPGAMIRRGHGNRPREITHPSIA